ncbi:MAG: hypothetical protein AB7P04_00615 [Bacteriovoracia bacterium]
MWNFSTIPSIYIILTFIPSLALANPIDYAIELVGVEASASADSFSASDLSFSAAIPTRPDLGTFPLHPPGKVLEVGSKESIPVQGRRLVLPAGAAIHPENSDDLLVPLEIFIFDRDISYWRMRTVETPLVVRRRLHLRWSPRVNPGQPQVITTVFLSDDKGILFTLTFHAHVVNTEASRHRFQAAKKVIEDHAYRWLAPIDRTSKDWLFLENPATAAKRYDRALIWVGGGLNTGYFLGMLDGAIESNWKPDVIVATCGSSLAGAIAHHAQSSAEMRQVVESREFYELLQKVEGNNTELLGVGMKVLELMWANRVSGSIPALDEGHIFHMDPHGLPGDLLKDRFRSEGIRLLVVGAKANRSGKKIQSFTPTYFTDAQTGALLKDFLYPLARQFPDSKMTEKGLVVTSLDTSQAIRATISDAYLINPLELPNGEVYGAGAHMLHPLELGPTLARESMMMFPGSFGFVPQETLKAAWGIDNNERVRHVTSQYADYWIDGSDNPFAPIANFNEHLDLGAADGHKVWIGLPNRFEEYVRGVRLQWEEGRLRAIEALSAPYKNDKAHIRQMNEANTSKETREAVAKYRKRRQTLPAARAKGLN